MAQYRHVKHGMYTKMALSQKNELNQLLKAVGILLVGLVND
jgi:hypothetical protein